VIESGHRALHAQKVAAAPVCSPTDRGLQGVLSQTFAYRPAWPRFGGNGISGEHVMIEFKGSHFERDVILWTVRWYVAYPVSCTQVSITSSG
jgi:hypothetical protein